MGVQYFSGLFLHSRQKGCITYMDATTSVFLSSFSHDCLRSIDIGASPNSGVIIDDYPDISVRRQFNVFSHMLTGVIHRCRQIGQVLSNGQTEHQLLGTVVCHYQRLMEVDYTSVQMIARDVVLTLFAVTDLPQSIRQARQSVENRAKDNVMVLLGSKVSFEG